MRNLTILAFILTAFLWISCSKNSSRSSDSDEIFYCNIESDGRVYHFNKMPEYGKNSTDVRTFKGYELAAGTSGGYEYYFMIRMKEEPVTPVIGSGCAYPFTYNDDRNLDYCVCAMLKKKDHNGNYVFHETTLQRHVIESIYYNDTHRFVIAGKFEFRFKLSDSEYKTFTGKYILPIK